MTLETWIYGEEAISLFICRGLEEACGSVVSSVASKSWNLIVLIWLFINYNLAIEKGIRYVPR